MTQTHIKLVSEKDLQNIPWGRYSADADGIVNIAAFLAWFNSLASAPEVGEAVAEVLDIEIYGTGFMKAEIIVKFLGVNTIQEGDKIYTTPQPDRTAQPIPVSLKCPKCGTQHIDEGEWATRPHKTHQCQQCMYEWRPYEYPTVGVTDSTAQLEEEVEKLKIERDEFKAKCSEMAWHGLDHIKHGIHLMGKHYQAEEFAELKAYLEDNVARFDATVAEFRNTLEADNKRLVDALREISGKLHQSGGYLGWDGQYIKKLDTLLADMEAKGC